MGTRAQRRGAAAIRKQAQSQAPPKVRLGVLHLMGWSGCERCTFGDSLSSQCPYQTERDVGRQHDSRAWTARVIEGDHDIEGDMNYHLGERLKLEEWRRGERDGENITERERWVLLK